ncbi:hypothetical protein C3K47_17810 [Solitalea longa]|uniref:Uncharacterized protein n=1 Tax=Solitalea longa TaxID=2079460 RepID=A0A2S4ZY32_9SPHI|nr:Ig-like domain-containing protein [Solitalea longa]POY34959.1 hypothetical protein C3K47_17810 [Solitalea longa]
MKYFYTLITLLILVFVFSCTKEDDELPKTNPEFQLIVPSEPLRNKIKLSIKPSKSDSNDIGKVEFFAGNNSLGSVTSYPYEIEINTETLRDGRYTIKAVAQRKSNPSLTSSSIQEGNIDNVLYTVNASSEYIEGLSTQSLTSEVWIFLTDEKGTILSSQQIKKADVYRFKSPVGFKGKMVNVTKCVFNKFGDGKDWSMASFNTAINLGTNDSVSYNSSEVSPSIFNKTKNIKLTVANLPFNNSAFLSFQLSGTPSYTQTGTTYSIQFLYAGDLPSYFYMWSIDNQKNIPYKYLRIPINQASDEQIEVNFNDFVAVKETGNKIPYPSNIIPRSFLYQIFPSQIQEDKSFALYGGFNQDNMVDNANWLVPFKSDEGKYYRSYLSYTDKKDNALYVLNHYGNIPSDLPLLAKSPVGSYSDELLNYSIDGTVQNLSVTLIGGFQNRVTWDISGKDGESINFKTKIPTEIVDKYSTLSFTENSFKVSKLSTNTLLNEVSLDNKKYQNTLEKVLFF